MSLRNVSLGCALVLLLGAVVPAGAEEPTSAYAKNLAFVGGRAVQLAEAIPEDKYGWRPMDAVRSVSEAIMHIAAANYFFAGRLGMPTPEGVDPSTLESVTAKADCIAALKASNEQLSKAFDAVTDRNAKTDLFGREATVEDMMLIAIGHVHEHFGQLIAYARSNHVVPPWSQSQGDGG